jgi:hypothetical protein
MGRSNYKNFRSKYPTPPTYSRREEAKEALKLILEANDPASFAEAYFNTFEDCPPDFFNPAQSKIWREVEAATARLGWATRIGQRNFGKTYFATGYPEFLKLGRVFDQPKHFFSKYHLDERKDRLKEKQLGVFFWRNELGESRGAHDHLYGGKRLLQEAVYNVEVYSLEGLIRYLKKPLMEWTPENLAIYLEAKKVSKYLPRHSSIFGLTRCLR